jgi:hypothetical protein
VAINGSQHLMRGELKGIHSCQRAEYLFVEFQQNLIHRIKYGRKTDNQANEQMQQNSIQNAL